MDRLKLGLVARMLYLWWGFLCALIGAAILWLSEADTLPVVLWSTAAFLFCGLMIYTILTLFSRLVESAVFRKWFVHGRGGSARFGGPLAFARYSIRRCRHARIYLGSTLAKYDPRPFCRAVGLSDQQHMVSFGLSGSGKSTTAIWPVLAGRWPYLDNTFTLDPKAEHSLLTAAYRAALGFFVIILDPLGLLKSMGKNNLKTHSFNPLEEIDITSGRAKEDIDEIALACVIEDEHTNSTSQHFMDTIRALLTGVIAHVLSKFPKKHHNLPAVYDLLTKGSVDGEHMDKAAFQELLWEMSRNTAAGNAPIEAATMYKETGQNERGSITTTLLRSIRWIGSDDMRRHLMKSDFKMSDLKTKKTAMYVVLDFNAMVPEKQGRYMRTVLNLALRAMETTPPKRKKQRVLFILDEIAQCGMNIRLERAIRTLRHYNTKIWCLVQDWKALTQTLRAPDALLASGTIQMFGVGDPNTGQIGEQYLGKYLHVRRAGREGGSTHESQKSLLDTSEIMDTLRLDQMLQIVITASGDKLELKRTPFYPKELKTGDVINRYRWYVVRPAALTLGLCGVCATFSLDRWSADYSADVVGAVSFVLGIALLAYGVFGIRKQEVPPGLLVDEAVEPEVKETAVEAASFVEVA